MRFTSVLPVLAFLGPSLAAPQPDPAALTERALPSGHPPIDNQFLSENGLASDHSKIPQYTIKTNIYPSGFSIPTQPLTALPDGYTVAWNGVYDPQGHTVSFFPSSVLQSVIAKSTTTSDPGAPSATSTAPASATASPTTAQNGAVSIAPSLALWIVAVLSWLNYIL
ncbi:hypothetical protein GSI_06741 [Ganoderma sinense ZZ0214-1]|uniref:Transporter n=1 Tax=Ganoderma sinense ZZ0214-1 TaxID=1077348 RepID=A0A2G8SEA1_9APHY|nr:hypothetical protein GSI_06741 [Ganoderma sinense ZZ0214-1]